MEEQQFNRKEYEQIRQLVATCNQKGLQSMLGFKSRNSRLEGADGGDSPSEMYPSTPKASALFKLLQSKLSGTTGEGGNSDDERILSVDDILQALLMIDPIYITPWNALVEFASALGNDNDSMSVVCILQCVSSIEEFLLKTKFSFTASKNASGEDLVPRRMRQLMVRFVETLTDRFLYVVEEDRLQWNRTHEETRAPVVTKLSLELLRTVLKVCQSWCSNFFNDIVSIAQFRKPSSLRIKIWLQLAQLSFSLLTSAQMERIGMILMDLLCDSSQNISPAEDIPIILSIVVEIARTLSASSSSGDGESSKNEKKLWRRIAVVGLYQTMARYDEQCYLQSEISLKEGIKKLNISSLKIWISEIIDASAPSTSASDENTIPVWFAFNLISLFTEVLRDKEVSSKPCLMGKAIGLGLLDSKDNLNSMSGQECLSILDLVLGGKRNSLHDDEMDRIFYRNRGLFYFEQDGEEKLHWLSRCGSAIVNGLHLEERDESHEFMEKFQSSALPRAVRLVSMVDHILLNCPDDCLIQSTIVAIAIKTVAYFEVPEFRLILEGKIEQDVSKPSRLQNSQFSAMHLIACSALKANRNDEMKSRWIEIIYRSIPFSDADYLNRIRTILPLARSSILNFSKKLLAPLYSSWGSCENEVGTNKQTRQLGLQQRNICGLSGLLELIRDDEWGKDEIGAWAILSDAMVKDLPPLPFESRQWLFQTLASYVTDGIFSSETVDRILRACTVRISSFFMSYELESKILANTMQMEEIRSLHRLMTILFTYLAGVDRYSEDRHIILAKGREAFLRAILLYRKGQFERNQFHHCISKQYHSFKAKEPDSFTLCWLSFLKINLYLLDNNMPESSKAKAYRHLESTSVKHESSLLTLVGQVKEIEHQDIQVDYGADAVSTIIIPSWPHTQNMSDFHSLKYLTMESIDKFPCLDLPLEFLFLVPLPARESGAFDDPLLWKVTTATGFLTSQKQISSKTTECILNAETIKKTAEPFLSISSFLFRGAINFDCGLSALDELFAPIVSYCQVLHSTLEATEVPDVVRIIGNLWKLYQAVASEKACVNIIKYLESRISENHDVSTKQRDPHLFSLSSIHTERDIDKTVQQLRLSCLQPFLSCLSQLSNAQEVDTIFSVTLVGGILGALVTDLQAGLEGNSGGVPRQLYIIYCMSIEECGSLLFHRRQASFDKSIFLLFNDVISTLSDILVTVPLRDAILFRTTFILAVAVFPSMCRDMLRGSLCSTDAKLKRVGKMQQVDSNLFNEVLEDCIDILIRWAALREPWLIPWLDIAGPDHSETENHATLSAANYSVVSNDFGSKQDDDQEIPQFVHVPSPTRSHQRFDSRPKKAARKIRLYTKELWSWALSCSLLGLEQKWLESERTIQASGSLENGNVSKVASIEWKEFFGTRRRELQNSLHQINRFFHTSRGLQQRDQRGNQIILDMMAMNLPSAPRLRFCCLIECISRVLIHSIQCLTLFWRANPKSPNPDISVFESMCCFSAWLSLEEHPEKDFSVGVFKWLAMASRKRPPGETSFGTKSDKAELFKRVSEVSEQVHKLYLMLKELQKLLQKGVAGEQGSFQSELLRSFFKGEDRSNKILRYTEIKLHLLEQVIPNEFLVKSFPDFPSITAAEITSEGPPGRKRVRSERRQITTLSKKKKSQIKSRNKVVNMFMTLDKGTSSPRSNAKDAYADLEDFLVEG